MIIDSKPTLLIYTEKCLVILFEQTASEIFLHDSACLSFVFLLCLQLGASFLLPIKMRSACGDATVQ